MRFRLLRRLSVLAYRTVKGFFDDGCSQRAAAISYYVLFSIFPLVIFTVALLGFVLRDAELQADVVDTIMDNIPLSEDEGRNDVTDTLEGVANTRSSAVGLFGLVALGWTASSMFGAVRSSLNAVFRVETPRTIVLQKLYDLGLVLAFAPFFIASVIATSVLQYARTQSNDVFFLGNTPHDLGAGWWAASAVLPIVLSFMAFAFVYWRIPNRRTPIRYVVPGAFVAAILFEAVKIGFSVYLENFSSYDVVFGSLGAVVAFLFWVYLSASILLLCAELISELPDVMAGVYDARQPSTGPKRTLPQKVFRFLRGLVWQPGNDRS